MQCIVKWQCMYGSILFLLKKQYLHRCIYICARVMSAAITKGPKIWWFNQERIYFLHLWWPRWSAGSSPPLGLTGIQANDGSIVFNTWLSKLLTFQLRSRARDYLWSRLYTSAVLPLHWWDFPPRPPLVAAETESFSSRWAATFSCSPYHLRRDFSGKLVVSITLICYTAETNTTL